MFQTSELATGWDFDVYFLKNAGALYVVQLLIVFCLLNVLVNRYIYLSTQWFLMQFSAIYGVIQGEALYM